MIKEIKLPNKEVIEFADQVATLLTPEEKEYFIYRTGSANKDFKAQLIDLYGSCYIGYTIAHRKQLISEFLYCCKDGVIADKDWGKIFLRDLGVFFTSEKPESHFLRTLKVAFTNSPWYIRLLSNLIFRLLPKERPMPREEEFKPNIEKKE